MVVFHTPCSFDLTETGFLAGWRFPRIRTSEPGRDLFNNKVPYNLRDIYILNRPLHPILHGEAIIYISSFTEQTMAITQFGVIKDEAELYSKRIYRTQNHNIV